MPRRCLHGVHRESRTIPDYGYSTLPRRCLHGVHRTGWPSSSIPASIFASALPARSASAYSTTTSPGTLLCLGAACTECIYRWFMASQASDNFASALPARSASIVCLIGEIVRKRLCLGAACTECIMMPSADIFRLLVFASALPARSASRPAPPPAPWTPSLPRRCLHGVHRALCDLRADRQRLCLGAACTECILASARLKESSPVFASALPARSASLTGTGTPSGTGPLPRRCLHGVHQKTQNVDKTGTHLCLGAACTECIQAAFCQTHHYNSFASALPARSASAKVAKPWHTIL